MKLLMLLLLVGCGSGYEVGEYYQSCASTIKYRCLRVKPIFFSNIDLALCNTLEECMKKCEEYRKLNK